MRIHLCLVQIFLSTSLGCFPVASNSQDMRAQVGDRLVLAPVVFETEPKESIGLFTNIANAIFKPPGNGPFPAVVLMHTCGGVKNPHIKQHAQEMLKEGYVVLVVDSFGPRGMDYCGNRPLSVSAGVSDAYAGLAVLAGKAFVNKARIYQAGYSWGAIVSTLLSSPQSAALVASKLRFTATVSNYSNCVYEGKFSLVYRDADRPILMLMGGRDQELPLANCFPLVEEMKAAGSPISWHVFPEATHAWDKQSAPERGYVFNEQVTGEATNRMLKFMAQTQ